MGEITLGSFRETFELDTSSWSPRMYAESWGDALRAAVAGVPRVALMTWANPSASGNTLRAYVLYREGHDVFVQERLFLPDQTDAIIDARGQVTDFSSRETVSEDGEPISEWRTSLAEIEAFLRVAT